MKNEAITKCVALIDKAEPGDIFLSQKTSAENKYFYATVSSSKGTSTLLYSGAHSMCNITVDGNKINLEYAEFKSIKDLLLKKLQEFSNN